MKKEFTPKIDFRWIFGTIFPFAIFMMWKDGDLEDIPIKIFFTVFLLISIYLLFKYWTGTIIVHHNRIEFNKGKNVLFYKDIKKIELDLDESTHGEFKKLSRHVNLYLHNSTDHKNITFSRAIGLDLFDKEILWKIVTSIRNYDNDIKIDSLIPDDEAKFYELLEDWLTFKLDTLKIREIQFRDRMKEEGLSEEEIKNYLNSAHRLINISKKYKLIIIIFFSMFFIFSDILMIILKSFF